MANGTATAFGDNQSLIKTGTVKLPGWLAPALGLLLILTSLAISYVPLHASPAAVHLEAATQTSIRAVVDAILSDGGHRAR